MSMDYRYIVEKQLVELEQHKTRSAPGSRPESPAQGSKAERKTAESAVRKRKQCEVKGQQTLVHSGKNTQLER